MTGRDLPPVRQAGERMRSRLLRDDQGSILPLVIGYTALALAVIVAITAATSLYLARKELFTVADGAALVGAEAFPLDAVVVGDDGTLSVELDDADLRRDVRAYLARAETQVIEGLALVSAASPDGRSATVTVSGRWSPPFLGFFLPEGMTIEVTASARSVFG